MSMAGDPSILSAEFRYLSYSPPPELEAVSFAPVIVGATPYVATCSSRGTIVKRFLIAFVSVAGVWVGSFMPALAFVPQVPGWYLVVDDDAKAGPFGSASECSQYAHDHGIDQTTPHWACSHFG